jgi:ribosomal-protein-alanine N-acetyltransferase
LALMAAPAVLSLRSATEEDRSHLANLLHFESHVHRHLDWRRPLDWLGTHPFLVLENAGRITATLACPQDPPGVAWVRLFAAVTRQDTQEAWDALWPQAQDELVELGASEAAAIPLYEWFRKLVAGSGFDFSHNVVVLDWIPTEAESKGGAQFSINRMRLEDLSAVQAVDKASFAPLWQNSVAALQQAYDQSGYATVIIEQGRIVAYQLSTSNAQGLHLARLATHPSMQGKGLARALVEDLLVFARSKNSQRVTVNTQDNNQPSLGLYKKLGFKPTGERFPVFHRSLK